MQLSPEDATALRRLVLAGSNGDQEALTILFDHFQLYAWSVALRATRNRSIAEDAVLDGFAVALRSLDRLRDPLKFPSYLASCDRNEVLMTVRRVQVAVPIESLEEEASKDLTPEGAFDSSEECKRAFTAFLGLDNRQQQAILLIDVEGHAAGEVARTLGLTTNATYQLLYRARKALRLRYIAPSLDPASPQPCRDCNDKLAEFVDGTACARVIAIVEQHLTTCSDCRQRVPEARETCALLQAAHGVITVGCAIPLTAHVLRLSTTRLPGRHLWHHAPALHHVMVWSGALLTLTGGIASALFLSSPRATGASKVPPLALVSSMPMDHAGYHLLLEENSTLLSTVMATGTTMGEPSPSLTEAGSLPAGINFTDSGDGTGYFSGTPETSGSYRVALKASEGNRASVSTEVSFVIAAASVMANRPTANGTVEWRN